jgi:hypothetical protein
MLNIERLIESTLIYTRFELARMPICRHLSKYVAGGKLFFPFQEYYIG